MSGERVLVVEDDRDMREMLADELGVAGYEVVAAPGGDDALRRLGEGAFAAVVTDLMMPGMLGSELLKRIREVDRDVPVIIITAFGTIDSAVQSIKEGAVHYVTKPFRMEQLLRPLAGALAERHERRQLADALAAGAGGAPAIIARSPVMRRALELVARAAPSDSSVLLLGESGTGKELLARALHAGSPRRARPFVAVNCSAIPEALLESQLFGHRRGAFTDARADHRGLFLEADTGTVFLDEVGDLAPSLQGKLLRVLQEREVHPLGAPAPVAVDVRLVAATHQPLGAQVEEGRFRRDLYYRLNVIPVEVPPLRERPEDILPLVEHFLAKHGARLGRYDCAIGPGALERLRRYPWPGNVRELENAIERALVLGRGTVIEPDDLPEPLRQSPALVGVPEVAGPVRPLAEVERDEILRALKSVGGNKAAAARLLGMDRKTLYRKLESYSVGEEPSAP
ncbi:MAG: sigma-54-dependent Fis family transcriptional regulator [Candidatus Eisenbacteria bacterium]|uniref:Sigma-54-dependent Fis family transcriptional regulator n=1 Tax=Eiseniibacteriota bacterium TaxID=2212470 RepID=A0A538U8B4_UNCEI|nr:MAG: sigma-54-dependent Fis family transcriptional regulator [Candidatus Eisenbacteria bacterium]